MATKARPRNTRNITSVVAAILLLGALLLCLKAVWPTSPERAGPPNAETPDTETAADTDIAATDSIPVEAIAAESVENFVEITDRLDVADEDATKANWPTEVFQDQAKKQLDQLGELLKQLGEISAEETAKLADDQFACAPLRPENLTIVFRNGQITVSRGESAADEQLHQGPAGLAAALRELATVQSGATDVHFAFKIVHVELDGPQAETGILWHLSGHRQRDRIQQNGECICKWSRTADTVLPKLIGIESSAEKYEEIIQTGSAQPLFSDLTQAVLGQNPSYQAQLVQPINYWLTRIEAALGIDTIAAHGLAIADVSGDGLDDIYFCQPGGLPNRLFLQNPDGTATDHSSAAGIDFCDASQHAVFADFDNDGDQDLAVILNAEVLLLENDGSGHFQQRYRHVVHLNPVGLTAADYDSDGLLDLYVLNHDSEQDPRLLGNPIPFHDANNGGQNVMLQNRGSLGFADVTVEVGLDENNRRFTLAAAWDDFDNDGDQDLYVANDFGRNNLYRNDGGRFTDIAPAVGVEDISAGMSVSYGDYNNDGQMDLYVSNMFSSAGNRIAFQRKFRADSATATIDEFRRHARGNSLFENTGGGAFRDVSQMAGVTMGRWAWASLLADVNNDTWQDILIANGFITNEDTDDL